MPADTPLVKVEKVRYFGAEIVTYDRYSEDREAIGRPLAEERGLALAPSYDHPDIIEGQGTVALESVAQAREAGLTIDEYVICCGGGGLTAGCATILKDVAPNTKVTIAEPVGFAETWDSIVSGQRQHADISQRTLCDAIATPTPGKLTLPIMQALVSNGVSLTEDEVIDAVIFAFKYLKVVVEPGGAVALAAILSRKVDCRDKTVAATLSGGNIDPSVFKQFL